MPPYSPRAAVRVPLSVVTPPVAAPASDQCPPLPVHLPEVTDGPPVACECRCGICCRDMAIRATEADALREPRLALVGHPIAVNAAGDPVAWMLNALDSSAADGIGPCQFLAWKGERRASCTIHDTRPDVCRRLDCDALKDIAMNHLAQWRAALAAREGPSPEFP